MKINALVATQADQPLRTGQVELRDLQADDVKIEILYCGVCHSDLHMARNEWGVSRYPLVPGHEIVGRVTATGDNVTKFSVGETVGVGVMVDSCRECHFCKQHEEQYCEAGFTPTYNGTDKYTGNTTFGGYAQHVIADQNFVVTVPDNLALNAVAPLLCAGVTVWSPLQHFNVKAGDRVGVIGLGGLGHMAVKLASALGAEVTLFTTSPAKGADARRLGASNVVISRDAAQMAGCLASLDIILDCVAAPHDLDPYLSTLKTNGQLVLVGIPDQPHPSPNVTPMVFRRLSITGTSIGSIQETQQMLDFCGEHNITADVEMITGEELETAFERMLTSDVKYRFVIDMQKTRW
ncbi:MULTISPECIES: NAD(P)-dependent alcohol dehydrogenase [unclassified Pantoea]|uniref:NAD(P)-dependent alcohol dehydrogenase n=1 Tax=unclassified Pantoea TaxID=2630326 RepID=UPI001232068E|nr:MULTISPECIES: NAD(P)-dependent alcohol dehydrogenase [unclassified Pantoea]KAA5956560.1 NAD(P)-dependent alcohol dehydrogenase [Pantoea sp. VH_24]KAA5960405.1 NAD(P)-dependent alcohol dehydrogenase [Pantoea sp. VH_16]KAA5964977.1 NAD(P)-dependent alcohol dehydrogenase [Pantoea sp. VH_18]KAA5998403.1 NAD(P)-dependent alcohol dehydrogenase [Pantoea sp. M_1]KAA6000728.1 NAD(P)-dependent alcohol dehydrogenase [Pantoea sp. F_7]